MESFPLSRSSVLFVPFWKILDSENNFGMFTWKFNEKSWGGHRSAFVVHSGLQHGRLLSATVIQTIIRMQQGLRLSWEREKLLQRKVEIKRLEIKASSRGNVSLSRMRNPLPLSFSCLVSDTETCSPGTELLCHLSETPVSGSRR